MNKVETYQYDLVQKLSFKRYGGTKDELKAAKIILKEIENAGGQGEIMDFKIPAFEIKECKAIVNGKALEVAGYGCSGEIKEPVTLKIEYIEGSNEADFLGREDLSGCCAFVNALDLDLYKKLVEHKASAFVVFNGKYYETSHSNDLTERMLRKEFQSFGKIPGFVLWCKDALEILASETKEITLQLVQKEKENVSRDVLAVIEGTQIKNESIVLTGHYDSVLVGTGSWDNATGAAMLNQLYNHFLQNPPKRTLRFVWCGSEEQGLYGSINYIKQHLDLMDEIKFVFNFDMNGTVFGPNMAFVTGGKDLEDYYAQAAKEYGYPTKQMTTIHSSDSAPFALKGIPSLGLSRGGMGLMEIHTRHDLMPTLSAKEMYKNFQFNYWLISRFVNSAILPIERKLPEEMKKKAEEYFRYDKIENWDIFKDK